MSVYFTSGSSTDYSYTAGISNESQDSWSWDLGYTKGHNDLCLDIFNTVNPSIGSATEILFHVGTYNVEQNTINADISKALNVSSIEVLNLAFGAHYRSEKYWQTVGSPQSYEAGPLAAVGNDVGSSARPGIADENEVTRSNVGAYVDIEADITDVLLITTAVRFETIASLFQYSNGISDIIQLYFYKLAGEYFIQFCFGFYDRK